MPKQPDTLIEKLIDRLGDCDPTVRRNAAGALRLHGARAVAAMSALQTLTKDEDPKVRQEAEMALERLKAIAA